MRPNLNRIKILLVDDDLTMRELMRDMLKRAGFSNIMMAANAKAAIDIFNANQIDIIICDWVMPEVDGIEMTQYIRSLPPEKNSLVSIMMVSGNAGVHHITAARDAGINEYLVKPFNANDFSAV